MDSISGVYLIHYSKPISYKNADEYGDELHYIGCTTDVAKRFRQHRNGRGSYATQLAIKQGATLTLAAVYPGELTSMEQALTRIGASNICPICITRMDKQLYIDRSYGLHNKVFQDRNSPIPSDTRPSSNNAIRPVDKLHKYWVGTAKNEVLCKGYRCKRVIATGGNVYLSKTAVSPLCDTCFSRMKFKTLVNS